MRSLNYCVGQGVVASGREEIPADKTDYCWTDRRPLIGCAELFCQACKQRVRSIVGKRPAGKLDAALCAALYDVEDLGADPRLTTESQTARLHLCACAWVVAEDARTVDYYVNEQLVPMRWRCGGHKSVETPAVIEGLATSEPIDESALRKLCDGSWSRACGETLIRLHHRLAGSPCQRDLDVAVLNGMRGYSAERQALAVQFASVLPEIGARSVLEALAAGAIVDDAFDSATPPFQSTYYAALYTLAVGSVSKIVSPAEAALYVRRGIRDPRVGKWLLAHWGSQDAAWLLEQTEPLVTATPGVAVALFTALAKSRAVGAIDFDPKALAQRVAAIAGVDGAAMRAAFEFDYSYGHDVRAAVLAEFSTPE